MWRDATVTAICPRLSRMVCVIVSRRSIFHSRKSPPPWRRGGLSRDQACAVVAPAQHAPEPLPQRAVCARSPGTTRATAVREVHRLIDQRVRNDVELPVDVIHRPVNAPLRKRVADLGACAEVRPQGERQAAGGFHMYL